MNKEIAPCLDEIRAVLKKHDMAGLVIVSNPTHTDFTMELDASWNCFKTEHHDKGVFLRIRSKRDEYPNRETQHAVLQRTVGTVVTIGDVLRRLSGNVEQLLVRLSKSMKIEGVSTLQREQDDTPYGGPVL